jgi:hypothetical protein
MGCCPRGGILRVATAAQQRARWSTRADTAHGGRVASGRGRGWLARAAGRGKRWARRSGGYRCARGRCSRWWLGSLRRWGPTTQLWGRWHATLSSPIWMRRPGAPAVLGRGGGCWLPPRGPLARATHTALKPRVPSAWQPGKGAWSALGISSSNLVGGGDSVAEPLSSAPPEAWRSAWRLVGRAGVGGWTPSGNGGGLWARSAPRSGSGGCGLRASARAATGTPHVQTRPEHWRGGSSERARHGGGLAVPGVECTHNGAERAPRFGGLWRKRSQGTCSEQGNRWVERSLSLRHTCRIRGRPTFPILVEAVSCLFNGETPALNWITHHASLSVCSTP